MKAIAGVWTALITPFNIKNELDIPAFRRIIQEQRDAGVAGVIPCGTTGESPTLTIEEKKTLILTALEELKGSPTQVVAGTGTNNTEETIQFSRWASEQGVSGILVVTPYYNKPSQLALEKHFRAIADQVSCDVILYNVPGRTGVSLSADTICALASHPRITAIKEATGNVAFSSEIIDCLIAKNRKMAILSGDDATYLPALSVGVQGVISVASNLIPRTMVAIQRAFFDGRSDEAKRLHQNFFPVFRDLFIDSNPVPIKYAMSKLGWCDNRLRTPLLPLTTPNIEKLELTLNRCGISRGKQL